jgi:pimeloyl-ACP methyl ester carboxylesterase
MKRQLRVSVRIQIDRFFRLILPAIGILILGVIVIFGFMTYKITHPEAVPEPINPSFYLLPSLEVTIPATDGTNIPAWWIPGLKNAPGIILAPGYGMNRSDALSLAAELHENGFNVLVYAQRGSNVSPKKASTLGLYEADDLLNAIRLLQSRPESNPLRIGIWGVDLGAYAALKAAGSFPEVRAIAVDSAFGSIREYMDYRILEDFGLDNRLVQFSCYQMFRLVHIFSGFPFNEPLPLKALSECTILFIKGENRPFLGTKTANIYNRIHPQKEMTSFKTSRIHMMEGEDLKSYDRQVANFFNLNLHK